MKNTKNIRWCILALAICSATLGCSKKELAAFVGPSVTVEEWKSGWKTDNVKATRYKNPHIGYNIGFTYPGHENECDRAEIIEFMEKNGGSVYQCGGYPGAEMFATFKDVNDKESANKKLNEILPALDALVASL